MLNLDDEVDVVRVLARVHVWPLTRDIARASTTLDIKGDPADELIAATSLVHKVPLVTRIVACSSRHGFPWRADDAGRPGSSIYSVVRPSRWSVFSSRTP